MDNTRLCKATHPTENMITQCTVHHRASRILLYLAMAIRTVEKVRILLKKLSYQSFILFTVSRVELLLTFRAGIILAL